MRTEISYRIDLDGKHDWYVPSLREAEDVQLQLHNCMKTRIYEVTRVMEGDEQISRDERQIH